jgi:hypothetical protein
MYKQIKNPDGGINETTIFNAETNLYIPFDQANRDYTEYLEWLSEGNEPLPADEPASQPADEV